MSTPASDIVVVDTDVVSFLFKGDTRAALYRPHLDGKIAMIAAQTRAELDLWPLTNNWGERRISQLHAHLRNFVLAPFDESICLRWAEVMNNANRTGRPIQTADAWVAATALSFSVPLVTHNEDDFKGVPSLILISEK